MLEDVRRGIELLKVNVAFVFLRRVSFEAVVSNQGFYVSVEFLMSHSAEVRAVCVSSRGKKAGYCHRKATRSRKGQKT